MSNMFFIVCIVAIACATGVLTEYFKSRRHVEVNNKSSDETLAQLEALEERIRVLERIVTEKNFDLKREIDKL
jgi:hypothetical protein